jgi:hypothetical protein
MGHAMPSYVGIDIGASGVHEGSNAIALLRRKHSQATGACTAQDTDKNGFGPVVCVVAGGDSIGSYLR